MKIFILTLFPEMFRGPFDFSILKRAQEKKLAKIALVNIRDFATDSYGTVDDKPYGGGLGMLLKVDVLDKALSWVKDQIPKSENTLILLLDPKGEEYTQKKAQELALLDNLVLLCGHYEGVDERIRKFIDGSVSMGSFVLTGGEIPALAIVDSVIRLIPGVLKPGATITESFSEAELEHPQYTRPKNYKGMAVPEALISGNHSAIAKWKKTNTVEITKKLKRK